MTYLQNLSLRTKLIIATAIPLLALLYYLQNNIVQEITKKQVSQQVIADVWEIREISKLIHEIQRERALSLTFMASNGTQEKAPLTVQREATDQAIASLEKILRELNRSIKNFSAIDSLPSIRVKADALRPESEVDPFYFEFKNGLLDEVSFILRSTPNISLKNNFEEHLNLLYAKDFLAQLRSSLAPSIQSQKFEGTAYGNFAFVKGKHEFNMQKFRKIVTGDLKEFFQKKYQGPFVEQTYQIID